LRVTTGAAQSVGQTAVSSAQRAEELLNSAQTREQLMAALDWMQNDMETSLDKAEEYLQRRQLAFEERGAAVGGETGAAPIDYSAPFWQTPAGKKLLERQRQQAPR